MIFNSESCEAIVVELKNQTEVLCMSSRSALSLLMLPTDGAQIQKFNLKNCQSSYIQRYSHLYTAMYEVQMLISINSWTCTQGLSVVWYFGVQTSSCCLTDVDSDRLEDYRDVTNCVSAPDQLYRGLCHNLHVVCRLTEADITRCNYRLYISHRDAEASSF